MDFLTHYSDSSKFNVSPPAVSECKSLTETSLDRTVIVRVSVVLKRTVVVDID